MLSHIRFRIFNLSGIAAFIKNIVYYGFHEHRPKYWSTIARKSQLKYECPEPPYGSGLGTLSHLHLSPTIAPFQNRLRLYLLMLQSHQHDSSKPIILLDNRKSMIYVLRLA